MRFGRLGSRQSIQLEQFEALAKAAETTLFRVAIRLTGNLDDAKDLLQDALLEAYSAFGKFQPGGNFSRWVVRIMTNTFIDSRRRRSVRPATYSLADLGSLSDGNTELDLPAPGGGPEDEALSSEFRSVMEASLQKLPMEYRAALVLCDMEELSYAEAAEALGCPEGTIRSRLYRARHAMRRLLGAYLAAEQEKHVTSADLHSEGEL